MKLAVSDHWWQPWRLAIASVLAIAIFVTAFLIRFNTLGGTLGGFDNDHFIYLVRTDRLLAGEQPLRDFVDAELRGAWPALTYAVSAWAQRIGGTSLLPEAYLTVGLLAAAATSIFGLALAMSRRWSIAVLSALATIATMPKLYNYPKVLALVLGASLAWAVIRSPRRLWIVIAAVVTAAAALFRHDLGIYPAAGLVAGLIATHTHQLKIGVKAAAAYTVFTIALLAPSLIWIQMYAGLPDYIRDVQQSVTVERARTQLDLVPFNGSELLALENLERLTYYVFWTVPALAALVLVAGLTAWNGTRLPPASRGLGVALLAMATLANLAFLRANLAERFGDSVAAVVLLAAWIAGTAPAWTSVLLRRGVVVLPAVVLTLVTSAAFVFSDLRRELDTSGLSVSWEKTSRRYTDVRRELATKPPTAWSEAEARGTLQAARYLAECTAPDDTVLVIGPIHEVPVYARRAFAAGQPMFKLSLYTSESFQRRAIERLQRVPPPVVLAEVDEFDESFPTDYPLVAEYVATRYRDAGVIEVDEDPRIKVLVASDRHAIHTFAATALPCFR